MPPDPLPPPPRHRCPPTACRSTTPPPKLLHRKHPAPQAQPLKQPSQPFAHGSACEAFFMNSPPPPPRHGHLAANEIDLVPATPDSEAAMADPRSTRSDLAPTYA
jgi:hypothetical protein